MTTTAPNTEPTPTTTTSIRDGSPTQDDPLNVLSSLLGPVEVISDHTHRRDPGKYTQTRVHGLTQALDRAARNDYLAWLTHIAPAAACTRPIRLRGESLVISETTGRIIATRSTDDMPDGVLYKACGNRRASVCPACAEIYRADTYQLVLAGLNGGKGVPASIQQHPCSFSTFTAPSFGPVHSTRKIRDRDGRWRNRACRPRRKPDLCPHGIDLRCHQTHHDGEQILGKPICSDCYDHDHQVVWNAMSGELWRRTTDRVKDILTRWAKAHGITLRLSFAKVAEMQARGVAHFHALIRLDGTDRHNPTGIIAPHLAADFTILETAIRRAVQATRFRTPPHPDNPDGWLIEWGQQLDVRPVRLAVDGAITETAVAGYLAKYATKATEATGHISGRITGANIDTYTETRSHTARLVEACWRLGRPGSDLDPVQASKNSGRLSYARLRRWAHMLGFGGHFSTKSRRYSTTLRALRKARANWRREQHRTVEHLANTETTLIVGNFTYADTGWRTIGDALLANTAAAKAREHQDATRDRFHQPDELDA